MNNDTDTSRNVPGDSTDYITRRIAEAVAEEREAWEARLILRGYSKLARTVRSDIEGAAIRARGEKP